MIKKFTLSLAALAVLSLLGACSSGQQTQTSQSTSTSETSAQASSSTNSSASSSSQASSSAVSIPDGTYTGTEEGDQIRLTITGDRGSWESIETDGEKEIKTVTVDTVNQRLTVGDDLKYYSVQGNQLILEDDDRDPTDTITLTK